MSLPLLLQVLHARSSDIALQSSNDDLLFSNSSNTTTVPLVHDDHLEDKYDWLRAVVAIVSFLSMAGAALIILSYVCIASIRTKSREILVHLSLADFGVACANFVGVVVDFDGHIRHCSGDYCNTVHRLCTAQAFFAGFSTIASILWTLALSVYIYMFVVHETRRLHSKSVYFFYLFCWGVPLLISLWLVFTGRLGHSPHGGSGWCSLKIEQQSRSTGIFIVIIGNDLWIYLTAFTVTLLYLTTHCHIRCRWQNTGFPRAHDSVVSSVDMKFLLIPLAFVLLRLGSMVVVIVFIYAQARPSLTVTYLLLCFAGIGDSGQGFVNAVLFCAFTAKVREKLKLGLARLLLCRCWKRHSHNYDLQYSTNRPLTTSEPNDKVPMLGNA